MVHTSIMIGGNLPHVVKPIVGQVYGASPARDLHATAVDGAQPCTLSQVKRRKVELVAHRALELRPALARAVHALSVVVAVSNIGAGSEGHLRASVPP